MIRVGLGDAEERLCPPTQRAFSEATPAHSGSHYQRAPPPAPPIAKNSVVFLENLDAASSSASSQGRLSGGRWAISGGEAGSVLAHTRSGLLQKPCLHATEGHRGSHLEQLGGSNKSNERETRAWHFFPEALRRVLLLKAAANFTCQLLMPTCRELLHLPTSHANLSRVTSPANFSCQLVESYFTC